MSGPTKFGSPIPTVPTDGSGNVVTQPSFDTNGNLNVNVQLSGGGFGTVGSQTTQITSTAQTTIVTAGTTGIYNHITGLQITNQTATAVTVTLKDGTSGTTRKVYDLAANGGIVVQFPYGLLQAAAAANWTLTLSASSITVDANVDFIESTLASL